MKSEIKMSREAERMAYGEFLGRVLSLSGEGAKARDGDWIKIGRVVEVDGVEHEFFARISRRYSWGLLEGTWVGGEIVWGSKLEECCGVEFAIMDRIEVREK